MGAVVDLKWLGPLCSDIQSPWDPDVSKLGLPGESDLVNYIKRSTADRTTEGTSQVDYLETVFQIKYQLWSPDGVIYS